MFSSHTHPRLVVPAKLAVPDDWMRDLSTVARPWRRLVAATVIAALSGLGIGLAMPRGPVTSGQALALLVVSVLVGFVAGWVLHSRWAMLLAPVAQIIVFEVTRVGASGPTVDGTSFDGTSGSLSFIVGRGFYGLVGTLPMIVAAAYGAALKMNVFRGLIDTFSVIYPHWQAIDFQRTAEHLKVPVYIFTGKHELAARRDLALAWFKRLDAPIKRLYDYPDAGHATAFEHFQDLHRVLIKTVLPATYSN